MYALDFEYDGQFLSDYGFIICDFDSPSGADVADVGSVITFNTVARNSGKDWSLTSTQYDECITTSFDICKNPDRFDDLEITDDEYRELMRWLNRCEFLKFQVFDEDDKERAVCYFNASFNVAKIKISEILYGLELTMQTDSPFGYAEQHKMNLNITDTSRAYSISDVSDEIGFVYPTMKITCNASGDLQIHNEFDDCTTEIKNCKSGDVITIDGDALFIASDNHKDVCNDFNYMFFKLGNSYSNRVNRITASLPCKIEMSYTPKIKDAP